MRIGRRNPGEQLDVFDSGRHPLSESRELGRAIECIKRAARLMDADPNDAQVHLSEAVWTLSQLRYNAMHGIHANPAGNPRWRLGRRRRSGGGLRYEGRRAFSYVGKLARRRRKNPALAILGGNPPRTLKALWATLEYQRPDDPDGKNVARVHEFKEGFIAEAMEDGSVILRHPRGEKLWTTR